MRSEAFAAAQVLARCAQAMDSDDLEALANCFVEDAVLRLAIRGTQHTRVHTAREAIVALFQDSSHGSGSGVTS
jgi:hypothetical protein